MPLGCCPCRCNRCAPVVGTMTLMANEVYMITRLAKLRGIKLSESAVLGLLGSLGGAFVGQTLATLIPFAPVQISVGMSVTYAVGKVANAWLEAGCPEDLSAFKTTYEEARIEASKCWASLRIWPARISRWAMKAVALRWMTIRRQIKRSTICCVR